MKIVKQSCSLIEGLSPYEHIEKVGRTCYKSEHLITEGSADKFVANLIKREHWAMLEHHTIYITMKGSAFLHTFLRECEVVSMYARIDGAEDTEQFKFFNWSFIDAKSILSGSFRAFHDLFLRTQAYPCHSSTINYLASMLKHFYPVVFSDIETVGVDTDFSSYDVRPITGEELVETFKNRPEVIKKHLTHTMHFVTDRGVSHEFVRHRVASFAQESTRYCNYSKDKFGNEIAVIEPCFWDSNSAEYNEWKNSCRQSEICYFNLITLGKATPQEARAVLPNSLKTELIITATEEEWQHIVNLRYLGTTGSPHPQMKESMGLIIEDLMNVTDGRVSDKGVK